MTQSPQSSPPGNDPKSFGRFTVEGRLGRGGMGVVYRAKDPVIGRAVAIKTLHLDPELEHEARETLQGRFEREFRSAGSLTHPNIVTVYDVGHQDDLAYIAMELVEGPSLEDLLRKAKRPSDEQVATILRELGDALDYAHRQGVVHRDVKPANILFSAEGRPKIADFGVAKARSTTLTTTGTLVGTPGFIAPEHVLGGELTGAADQFSLAVVAYRLLGGASPFEGEDSAATLYKIAREDPPPLHKFRPDLPPSVEYVLLRAMQKDPQMRFPSCTAFARELGAALGISSTDTLLAATRPSMEFATPATPLVVPSAGTRERDVAADEILNRPVQPRHIMADRAIAGPGDGSASGTYGDATGWWRRRRMGRRLLFAALVMLLLGAGYTYWTRLHPDATNPLRSLLAATGGSGESDEGLAQEPTTSTAEVGAEAGNIAPADRPPGAEANARVSAGPGTEVSSEAAADATPAVPIPTETFTITSQPPGASVLVDGEAVDGTTPLTVELLTGIEQKIELQLADYHPAGRSLTPEAGSGGDLSFTLDRIIPPGHIAVGAGFPVRASIKGRRLTVKTDLEPGSYQVRLLAPDLFYDETRTVTVEPGATAAVTLPGTTTARVAAVPAGAALVVDGHDDQPLEPPLDLEVVAGSRHVLHFAWPDGSTREETVVFDQAAKQIIGSPETIRVRGE